MSSTPIILDCDPGHDDVFAIWLAASHPAIDLRAITTLGGNGYLEDTTRNAQIALTVACVAGVPIAAGAAGPLAGELHTAEWIHGENALGGPVLPEPTVPVDGREAVAMMRDVLAEASEPVTIVATGPLTNVAILLRDHPEVRGDIARIVWMGGSTGRGNTTPYAEFNAFVDPEAIALVLGAAADAGIDVTMVGLNISHQARITAEVRERVATAGTATGAFGAELLAFFCARYAEAEGMPEAPLHDPITIALLIDPAIATTVRARLDAETTGTFTRGATSVDLRGILGLAPNATIAMELDVPRFWDLIVESVAALA